MVGKQYYHFINQEISYWLSNRSLVSCIGLRPGINIAYQGPVNEPVRNHLINAIYINLLSIKSQYSFINYISTDSQYEET